MSHSDVSCHRDIDCPRESEITEFDVTILVYEHITRLEITVDDTCRMNVFQAPLIRSGILDWPGE